MIWCGLWVKAHLLWFHWWFLASCHPFEQVFFLREQMNLKVGCDPFFFTLGKISSSVTNPWLFKVIFIGLFIIRFIVINVQIGMVHKHGDKTSTIRSIPCPTILNVIIFSEIGTCKNKDNLMFAQVSTQHPFTCVTNIFNERKWDLICHIWMLLALYHPCMAGFVQNIYPMGDMGVKD